MADLGPYYEVVLACSATTIGYIPVSKGGMGPVGFSLLIVPLLLRMEGGVGGPTCKICKLTRPILTFNCPVMRQ